MSQINPITPTSTTEKPHFFGTLFTVITWLLIAGGIFMGNSPGSDSETPKKPIQNTPVVKPKEQPKTNTLEQLKVREKMLKTPQKHAAPSL